MTRLAFILALIFTANWQEAETVDVEDRGAVDLTAVQLSGRHPEQRHQPGLLRCAKAVRMLVQRHAVYHQYCDLPQDTLDAFLNAPSMGPVLTGANIETAGPDGSGPYGCRTHKVPS